MYLFVKLWTGEGQGRDGAEQRPKGAATVYFDIHKSSRTGQYWWVAKGENHQTLCSSELLTTKQSCKDAIKVIKRGAATAAVYDETGEVTGDVAARRLAV